MSKIELVLFEFVVIVSVDESFEFVQLENVVERSHEFQPKLLQPKFPELISLFPRKIFLLVELIDQ